MTDQPIGVFDSGLGGLTAIKELLHILPHENIIYFGDTSRVPYGNRSKETIRKYAMQDTSFLMSLNVKMIIVACGTVSSVVTDLGNHLKVPLTGVVRPTCAAAACATKNGKIGVIGTSATIKSGSYRRELTEINPRIQVFEQDCPLFVPLVENGFIAQDDEITLMVAERYLSHLREAGVDTLILGCTHYPIISKIISKIMGSKVTLIDSGRETALYAAQLLKEQQILNTAEQSGNCSFYVSDSVDGFSQIAEVFLGKSMDHHVSRINIESF